MFALGRKGMLSLMLAVAVVPSTSLGFMLGLNGITNNSAASTAAGEAQLWVDVTSPQPNTVLFTFGNTGPVQSTIVGIHFEQGRLDDILSIVESGVAFKQVSPGVLPGGNGHPIDFVTAYQIDAKNPRPKNGVNNSVAAGGDTVAVLFSLAPNTTYQDVLSDLHDQQLRIGLHVQNFANGASESFLTHSPEPTTALLLLATAGMWMRRRS